MIITTPRRLLAVLAIGAFSLTGTLALESATPALAAFSQLSHGDTGDSVSELQQALKDAGHGIGGDAVGTYGPGTVAAVKQVQALNGLNVTGDLDGPTAIALGLEDSQLFGLERGDSGDAVELLQAKLAGAGHPVDGGISGTFNAATTVAIESYQRAIGFLPTGEMNAATADALGGEEADMSNAGSDQGSDGNESGDDGSGDDADADQGDSADNDSSSDAGSSKIADIRVSIGSTGADVERVQRLLLDGGYDMVGGVDGIFGVLTASAVKAFQADQGLAADGIVGPNTAAALAKLATGDAPANVKKKAERQGAELVGLKYGSVGSNVKVVQQALLDAGIGLTGGVDGVFGTATQAALKQFQGANGLETTGWVDEATADAINSGGSDPGSGDDSGDDDSNGNDEADEPAPSNGSIVGLKVGDVGSLVKQLQQALIDAGVPLRGGADGIFGPATHQGVEMFQEWNGLTVSGEVNEATVEALERATDDGGDNDDGDKGGGDGDDFPVYGESSDRVRALQQALINAGIELRGGADGVFGSATSSAIMTFQDRNGLPVTGKVDQATADALDIQATTPPSNVANPRSVQLEKFPVASPCGYEDTWHAPRSGGRLHLGVDIIAAEGTKVFAAADGKIETVYSVKNDPLAGNGVRLRLDDGTYLFYAHFQKLGKGIELGVPVKAGQVIGRVGSTGNTNTPHLHLEVHPNGGSAVNPYPIMNALGGC